MARERQDTFIGEHKYEMTMLGATPGYRLFRRLFKMFGPSLGALMDATAGENIQDVDLTSQTVKDGIQALTENVKESDLDHVIDLLKGQTHVGVDGSEKTIPLKSVFESHFAGDTFGMFAWVWWGLQVQYATFSSAFASMKPPSGGEAGPAASKKKP